MSSRERWIVYPMLFFAFCLAARDQFPYLRPEKSEFSHLSCRVIEADLIDVQEMVATDLRADSIEGRKGIEGDILRLNTIDTGDLLCERLLVQSTKGQPVAELASTGDGAGRLTIYNADRREVVVLADQNESGQMECQHHNGPRLLIRATEAGGTISVVDADDEIVAQFDIPPANASPET
jgi:hypothetical protein